MFFGGSSCTVEPLLDAGEIDTAGNLVGDAGASRSAPGAVKKEHTAEMDKAGDTKIPGRNKPASKHY
ncbi:MAG: hypothetical protein PHQ09_01745 [Actinomycetota bacterium]|jgi:hypothetical protein|nr:hypothetical protein [Actinomycetota bacterium]